MRTHSDTVKRVLLLFVVALCHAATVSAQEVEPATEPPVIPIGSDAFTQWDRWPYLRIGVRAYMKSTFDRKGGNHFVDSGHFIRQVHDQSGELLNVALDEQGPGILWFVRHNHWHGSPWHYLVDGRETVVQETSTADPLDPVPGSVFMPEHLFPQGLTYTWSVTQGADLSWVPIPFERRLQLTYGRTRYGTGYFILWKIMPGLDYLSRPLEGWKGTDEDAPPDEVIDLLARSGTDIAPRGEDVAERRGTFSLAPFETKLVWRSEDGPAQLRRLAFRVPEAGADDFSQARLRIYWDGREEPSVDAPLGLFFGTATLQHDPEQEYVVKAFPMTVRREEGRFLFATYFPMPFHRSARVEVAERTGRGVDGVTWDVRHEPFAGAPNEAGWFHATYRDFPKPQPGRDLELLDTRRVEGGGPWSGHIVGTTYVFTRQGNLRTLEGDPRFYFDDSRTPQGQGTGSEEWGGGGDYWGGRTMTLPFAGHPVGKPGNEVQSPEDRVHSAYRFLLSDLMPFGRNARVTLEHGAENQAEEHYSTVTYWYGLDQPSLLLTDELDVGRADDERRHTYESPEASTVDTLVSRYEWGVDQAGIPDGDGEAEVFMPVADDGRRTTGRSEFTLRLQPDNLGVLLRRRLDLAYPNQRARIWVADAGAGGEAVWEEAGIWYTAGGRTTVFADPLSRPESERTMHPELAPPAQVVWTSERRWREEEFMIPRRLTEGRSAIRVRIEHRPVGLPLFPGHPLPEEAWTAYRYWAYSIVMPGAYTPAGFALQLAAHYTLDKPEGTTLPDQSGNDHHAVPHGLTGTAGAAHFDGEAFAEVGSDTTVVRMDRRPWTVGAWVRPTAEDGVVISLGGGADGFSLYLQDGTPAFAFRRFGVLTSARTPEAIPTGQWVHLAAALTADHDMQLYVNGEKVASERAPGLLEGMPVDRFLIGADQRSTVGDYASGLHWQGLMRDLRVYWGSLDEPALKRWVEAGPRTSED